MANSRDPRMDKVYDKKRVSYHCVSLKKRLSEGDKASLKPFENSLRQQDKVKPPYGKCHHCHDMGHWIGDCQETKKLRVQQMSTDKKKPTYRRCYICGLVDHLAPNCLNREDDFTSQQTESSVSTENQQTASSVSTEKPSSKRKVLEIDIIILISVLREDTWALVQRRQPSVGREERKLFVSFVNQTLTHLAPVHSWWRKTVINQF